MSVYFFVFQILSDILCPEGYEAITDHRIGIELYRRKLDTYQECAKRCDNTEGCNAFKFPQHPKPGNDQCVLLKIGKVPGGKPKREFCLKGISKFNDR